MKVLMYLGAVLNALFAGMLIAFVEPKYAAPNLLVLLVICVDQVCEALKERA